MMKKHTAINWTEVHRRLQASEHALQAALHPDEKAIREQLDRRAQRIAESRKITAATDALKLLVVRVGESRFAVELKDVAEVGPLHQCTPVPGASKELVGVICHRGEARSVVDLALLLDRASREASKGGCFVHVRAGDRELRLRVDEIEQILSAPVSDLIKPAAGQAESSKRHVRLIHRDGIEVLNVESLCGTGVEAAGVEEHTEA